MLNPDKTFKWTVTDRGKPHVLEGRYESDNGELLLSPTQGEALDGRVSWHGPTDSSSSSSAAGRMIRG